MGERLKSRWQKYSERVQLQKSLHFQMPFYFTLLCCSAYMTVRSVPSLRGLWLGVRVGVEVVLLGRVLVYIFVTFGAACKDNNAMELSNLLKQGERPKPRPDDDGVWESCFQEIVAFRFCMLPLRESSSLCKSQPKYT